MTGQCEKQIETLYRAHLNELFAYAIGLGFDGDASMDAIHDVFCRICNDKILRDKDVTNVRAYLFRAVKNRLLDFCKIRRDLSVPADETDGALSFGIEVSVEEELIEKEERERLRKKVERLLESLTDRQREIIWLRYEQNLDYEAISQIMSITETSCRKLIHKAVRKLREQAHNALVLFFIHFF
jgi:RNA polymerase sigma factor (sigma-70 family)